MILPSYPRLTYLNIHLDIFIKIELHTNEYDYFSSTPTNLFS